MHTQTIVAFLIGLIVGAVGFHTLVNTVPSHDDHHDSHPIADPYDSEYHVHADFHIVVNGTLVDLDDNQFQTTSDQELHPDAHLHDNNGDVKHIHAEGVTFVSFLDSLSITLTDDCITLDNQYCTDDTSQLVMYVNDGLYDGPLTQYIPVDNDRILVWYGSNDPDSDELQSYLDAVPDDACFYSGTCPERGIAPPESCGLTCEL